MSHRHPPEWTSRAVAESVWGLQRILHDCDLFSRKSKRECGVSGLEIWALRTALDAECTTVDELAQRLHLHPSTVSNIVDRLESHDLASRQATPGDPLVTDLRLRASGRRLAFESPEPPHSKVARGIESLSPDDLECVHRAIEILGHILDVPEPASQDPRPERESDE